MPAKKRSSARATARSTVRRTSPAARRTTTRKPVLRRRTARRSTKPDALEPLELTGAGDEANEGPVVLGATGDEGGAGLGETPEVAVLGGPVEGTGVPPMQPEGEGGVSDRFPEDIPVMIASAVLAGSVFLPWYKIKTTLGPTQTATGWETGTWGPMILFLGVLSLALAVLRRRGVRVNLPVPDTYVHEGAGWLSLIGAIIKLRLAPKAAGPIGPAMGTAPLMMVPTIVSAFALAFLAGRMSGSVPLVTIPGWFRGKAGKIGLALLLVAIGGAGAFGTLNDVDVQKLATGRDATSGSGSPAKPDIITGRFPNCASKFPKPPDAKPVQGLEPKGGNPCVFFFSSKQSVDALLKFYKAALTKAGFAYKEQSGTSSIGHTLVITKPQCGSLTIQKAAGAADTTLTVLLGTRCQTEPPGGQQSGRSSPKPTGGQFAPPSSP